MGRGKEWTQEECRHLAEAYLVVSEDHGETRIGGSNQTAKMFDDRVLAKFKEMEPEDALDETYSIRTDSAIMNNWKDNIKAQCRKFNKCFTTVYNAKPTGGVTAKEKINVAAAIICGETKVFQYSFRSYDPECWRYYECWKVLRTSRGFQPPVDPSLPVDDPSSEEEDDEEGDGAVLAATNPENGDSPTNSSTVGVVGGAENNEENIAPTTTAPKNNKRGGKGRDGTSGKTSDAECKKQKLANQTNLVESMKKRTEALEQMVDNQATHLAYKMTKESYKMAKAEGNQVLATFYYGKMNEVMVVTDAPPMPPLPDTYEA